MWGEGISSRGQRGAGGGGEESIPHLAVMPVTPSGITQRLLGVGGCILNRGPHVLAAASLLQVDTFPFRRPVYQGSEMSFVSRWAWLP